MIAIHLVFLSREEIVRKNFWKQRDDSTGRLDVVATAAGVATGFQVDLDAHGSLKSNIVHCAKTERGNYKATLAWIKTLIQDLNVSFSFTPMHEDSVAKNFESLWISESDAVHIFRFALCSLLLYSVKRSTFFPSFSYILLGMRLVGSYNEHCLL